MIRKIDKNIYLDLEQDKKDEYFKKVGYFSGTFDPFHEGHLKVAQEVSKYLDEIWIQPHNFNPKKTPENLIHRIKIIELSISNSPKCFLLHYPAHLSQNKYKLMTNLEEKIKGVIISDVIGSDHLQKTINYGINRDVYCVTRHDISQIKPIPRIFMIKSDPKSISASSANIREAIRVKHRHNLPLNEKVLAYIVQNQLYL